MTLCTGVVMMRKGRLSWCMDPTVTCVIMPDPTGLLYRPWMGKEEASEYKEIFMEEMSAWLMKFSTRIH